MAKKLVDVGGKKIEEVDENTYAHEVHEKWGEEWKDVGRAFKAFFTEGIDLLYFWRLGERVKVKKSDNTEVVKNRWRHDLSEFSGASLRLCKEINDIGPAALAIYALLVGGVPTIGAKGCTSLGIIDPYSIENTRALESSV